MDNLYKKKLLLVLGLMLFLANGDNYAAASLISKIADDLTITLSQAAWSVIAYMLSFGVFTLIFGPLSDRFGKVKVFIAASMGTAIFSILGAAAFNLPSLIVFRAINGMFGAGIFPVALALIGESFATDHRQKALAKAMGMAFLGAATATAIGGALAYFGSWRFVYLIYGIGEFVLAIMMTRLLIKDRPQSDRISSPAAYKILLSDARFLRLTLMIFLTGFSVFGSFTYSGILIHKVTEYNIFAVGLILSVFGVGTVVGGQLAPKVKHITKNAFLVVSGLLGCVSLYLFSGGFHISLVSFGLLGFGIAFIFLQSTLVTTIQEKHPDIKGTVMSMSGFNMFSGGACGTAINAMLMKRYGPEIIFEFSAFVFLIAALLSAIFVSRFEARKLQGLVQSKEALKMRAEL
jgi:predicted MFS family arabinose efflux permease